jgi:DNA polymerase
MTTELPFDGTPAGWKNAARSALLRGISPGHAQWIEEREPQATLGLLQEAPAAYAAAPETPATSFRVPREFVALAAEAGCHRDSLRWSLLYRVLWRLTHGEPHLLEVAVDPDVHRVRALAQAVHRDIHKMHAFVRFREVTTTDGPRFVAWFEPQHLIVEAAAPFFVDRFAAMRWSILTPDRCAHWDGRGLTFSAGLDRSAAPPEDATEDLWRTYYGSIFNPGRVKVGAMLSQMPRHYWKNLPEAAVIPTLLAQAAPRVETMLVASAAHREPPDEFAAAPVPRTRDLALLHDAAASCRACPLWRRATCTVFGQGPARARIVVVGEQPGDQEDRAGQPFVGPAGQLFDRALRAAGINREELYVTNAVKHFKWEPRGKRRLHQKPNAREVAACRHWLVAELESIQPHLIVCLGATAAQSVLGTSVRITEARGTQAPTPFGIPALLTVHPSSLLRLPPGADPEAAFRDFTADLAKMRAPILPQHD